MAFPRGLMAIPQRISTILLAVFLLIGGHMAAQAATTTTFTSTNVPLAIPLVPNLNPMTGLNFQSGYTNSTVQVSGIATAISNVTVSVYIGHDYVSDLRLVLLAPGVTYAAPGGPNPIPAGEIILASYYGGFNRGGGFLTGYGTSSSPPTGTIPNSTGSVIFSDAAATFPITSGGNANYVYAGTYLPQNALSGLSGRIGTQVNGTWTLRVNDDADLDAGTLFYWSISITEPGPHVWTGLSTTSNNWSDAANWQSNNLPTLAEAAALITFPTSGSRLSNINDIGDIKVGVLNIAGGYTIDNNGVGANRLTMAAAGAINGIVGTPATAIINMPVDLIGAATITTDAGVILAINGVIADAGAAAGGLAVNGPGTLQLTANNTFSGTATINSGIVEVSNNGSLGLAAGATTVNPGGTILTSVSVTAEPLILAGTGSAGQGALAASANVTWDGPITLVAGNTGFGATASNTLTITNIPAAAAGSYGFSKVGTGNVVLNATLPVSTVLGANAGGTLTVGAAQPNLGGISLTGGTIIASGANLMTLVGGISCSASPTASTITGSLDVGAAQRAIDVAAGSFLTLSNALTITGAGGVGLVGGGTVTWSTNGGVVPVGMTAGTLAGAGGAMGALTVSAGTIDRSGPLATGALNLGMGSLLRFNGSNDHLDVTGGVTLGGGLLQPFAASGLVIDNITPGAVTGIFRGMTEGNGVTYQSSGPSGGNNDIALTNLANNTVFFNPTAYTVRKNNGPVILTVTCTGGPAVVAIDSFGGSATAGADFILPPLVAFPLGGGTQNVTLILPKNYVSRGDKIANLVLIPVAGCRLLDVASASATVLITDDSTTDKKCGIGTGLTVFFLFGFGLLLRLRLRRR